MQRKKVVIITYNFVLDYKSGLHKGAKYDVYIYADDQFCDPEICKGLSYKDQAERALAKIRESFLSMQAIPRKDILKYVVYSGSTITDSMIGFAIAIKKITDKPVEVWACRCSWQRKEQLLHYSDIPLIETHCGGLGELRKLVERTLAAKKKEEI